MAKSIDEKTRKLASQRPENGKEFQQMQAAQNQLLEIQAAQKQNVMEQKLMAGAEAEQRQLMAQAAEVGAGSVAGNMQLNQATQQTMGRYGLAQPRTSSSTKQTQSQTVTRQNVTIHNNTTNITNNTVPANIGGPIQGRPIQFQQPVAGSDASGGMGKFKNWLNQTFARQEEAAKKRNREYERRETSLTKNANKMMRKIEEFSKDITKKLDPRNVGRTVGGQLKTILGLLGLGIIAKNFNKLLDWIENAQNKVENEYIPNIRNFFAWVKGDGNAKTPGLVTKLTEGIANTFGKLFYGKDYTPNGKLMEEGLLKGISKFFWNNESGENRGILNKAFDYIKEEFQRRSKMAKESITLDKSETFWDIIHNPGAAFKEFLTNLTNYLGVLVGGDAVMSRIQGKAVEATAMKMTTNYTTDPSATTDITGYQNLHLHRTPNGVRKAYAADSKLLEFQSNNYNNPNQYVISKHYLTPDGNNIRRGDLGATAQVSNNLLLSNHSAEKGTIYTSAVANDLSHLYTEARSNGEVLVNSANFNITVKHGTHLGEFLLNRGLLRKIEKGELWLVLRKRPQEELEKDLKKITPEYKKVAAVLRKLGFNWLADVNEGTFNIMGLKFSLPTQIIPDLLYMLQSGTLALVEEKILKPDQINPEDGDITLRDVSDELTRKGYLWAKPEAISALAYYGYMTEEDRSKKSIEDISFNLSDNEFVGSIQRALESRSPAGEKSYDYDATKMAENSRAANYQKEAPRGTEYNTGTRVEEGSSGGTTEGTQRRGGLLTQEQLNAGVTRESLGRAASSSSPEGANTTSPDSAEPEQVDKTYTTSSSDKFIYGAEGAFDPEAAAKWVAANYSERSKGIAGGLCSDFVGMGLRNGGSGAPGAGTVSNLEDYLKAHGWYDTGLGPNDRSLWQVGDVSIIYKKKGKRNGNGHTSMYVGNGYWISDVKHKQYSGGWEGCEEIHIYRYRNDPNVSHTGSPGREWNRRPNVNHVKYAVDRWWRLGRSKERWGGVGALFAGTNGRSYNRVPGDYKEVKAVLENPDSTIADFIRVAYKPVTTDTLWSPTEIAQMYGSGVNARDVSDISFNGEAGGDGFFGKAKSSASRFFSEAKDVVKEAIGGLVHKVGEGTEWEADIHGGLANYDYGTKGPRSAIEDVMYGKYSGNERQLYDVLPKSIIKGTTSDRNEWWGGFFDHEGNLKIKDSDKVNPEIMNALKDIEGELKKGNGMDEMQLQLAATTLDNAMQHNAGQTARERRLINALTVQPTSMVPSMTEDNTDGI